MIDSRLVFIIFSLLPITFQQRGGGTELWPLERPAGMSSIQSLEVMCGKEHMDVHIKFTSPFDGLVFSKGQYGDPRCVYVAPGGAPGGKPLDSSRTQYSFRIAYRKCGTKPDLNGQFYENTVVIQYDKDLLEVWDEAKRLRCEWFNDYEKTASKPPMVIADLDVVQLDFRGDNVDCWMEIQHGKGPWAPPVTGIVPLGSTLTLVVAINDHRGEFDMRVKSCKASDGGGGHVIELTDKDGCVLRPKMFSKFQKIRSQDKKASVITYAFFHAFKFPDELSVHIDCTVEICRRGCQEHCYASNAAIGHGPAIFNHYRGPPPLLERREDEGKHDDLIETTTDRHDTVHDTFSAPPRPNYRDGQTRFPYGPRNLAPEDHPDIKLNLTDEAPVKRVRRFAARAGSSSEDVGVSGLYEVISEQDLAFSVDSRPEAVQVLQGRRENEGDIVYGICMPVQSLGALFIILGAITIAAALFAGTLFHRYQRQQESQRISSWLALRNLLSFSPHHHHPAAPVVQFTPKDQ